MIGRPGSGPPDAADGAAPGPGPTDAADEELARLESAASPGRPDGHPGAPPLPSDEVGRLPTRRGIAALGQATVRQWPLTLVLTICLVGLGVVLSDHFRRGTVLFAGGLVLAAGLRLLLPTPTAGLLAVRNRVLDVLTLAALGLGVLLTALVIPPPS